MPICNSAPDYSESQERLLRAALEIIDEGGISRATTRRIAERAGVNLQLIQYHFGSKDALIFAAQDYIVRRLFRAVTPAVESVTDLSSAVRAGIDATWTLALEEPAMVQPDLLAQSLRAEGADAVHHPGRVQTRVAELLEATAKSSGETFSIPVDRFALLLVSCLSGLILEYRVTKNEERVGEGVAILADMLVNLVESEE